MENINIKSLIIGALLTSTIFLGVAAVPIRPNDTGSAKTPRAWDDKQVWYVKRLGWDEPKGHATRLTNRLQPVGLEPFAATDKNVFFRKRIK